MTLQTTNLNVAPFYDDYDPSKNYHRILFRPRAVQARELNQAQDIMQDQIARFGRNIFTEGSMVIPGGINVKTAQDSVGFSLQLNAGTFSDIQTAFNTQNILYAKSASTGLTATITKVIAAVNSDYPYLFVDYTSTSTSGSITKFVQGEALTIYYIGSDGSTQNNVAFVTASDIAVGQWVQILAGTYFVHGHFVNTGDQEAVISKNTTNTTCGIGFIVNESIIDETVDSSLYSNALGTANYNSPGASRLKMSLALTIKPAGSISDSNFVEIASLEAGVLQSLVDTSTYSVINDSIAKRSYETNGNFTVQKFDLSFREHLLDASQTEYKNGLYLSSAGGDSTKFVSQIQNGIAYVYGYRVQNLGITNIVHPKARSTNLIRNTVSSSDYGNYILVNSLHSVPTINIRNQFQFKDSGGNVIGTTRVTAIRMNDATNYRLYLIDTSFNAGKTISNATTINFSDSSNQFYANLTQSVIFESSGSTLVFPLPYSNIATLSPSGSSGTAYTVLREFNVTTDANGNFTVTANAGETFGAIDPYTYFVGYTGASNTGNIITVSSSNLTKGGSPIGRSLTGAMGVGNANKSIKLIAPIIKSSPTQKTKTLTTNVETLSFAAASKMTLAKADIYSIVSVVDTVTGTDITSMFTFDNGQRTNWYQMGILQTVGGSTITKTVKVTYKYFSHSTGDFFSIDSYSGIGREFIPTISVNGSNVSLADCIDFRPLKDSSGLITSSTFYGEIVKPVDVIYADMNYYQPRIDCIYVDTDGNLSMVQGVPADSPTAPSIPARTMKIYDVYVPAYTPYTSGITSQYYSTRVYTMADIGKLDQRLSNVEYYTALNMLEQSANNIQVIDPLTGNNRYKNGFATDSFSDFSTSDLSNSEWNASLDLTNKVLGPMNVPNAADFSVKSVTNGTLGTRMYTLPYTNVVESQQPYATTTINVNPYAVYTWNGDVSLYPASDYWVDTKYLPGIVNVNYVNGGTINQTVVSQTITVDVGGVIAAGVYTVQSLIARYGQYWYNVLVNNDPRTVRYSYSTSTKTSTSTSSSTALISTTVIPKMRSINISFSGNNLKPFSKFYPFFNGVNVAPYCTPTGGTLGQQLVADSHGSVSGIFTVPCSSTQSFSTGTGTFTLTSMSDNSVPTDGDYSTASATFMSGGTTNTYQTTTNETVTSYKVVTTTIDTVYHDPLAQSFRINESGGCFVSKVDVFFSTKAKTIPVRVQIRKVVNGYPSNEIVDGATKTLTPDMVNISTDGTVATSFVFDDLVYLNDTDEYAIVILANTQEYNVYIAQMGQQVIGQPIMVSKQPAVGVFFTSSNSSTWTANQMQDLKFTIWRASFDTSSPAVLEFKSNAPTAFPLNTNALYSTIGSGTVVMTLQSHGLLAGDSFSISGAVDGNGFTAAQINQTFSVVSSTIDTVTFAISGATATSNGTFGGTSMSATVNVPFDRFYSNITSAVLSGSSLGWEYSYKRQTGRTTSSYASFTPATTVKLPSQGVLDVAGDFLLRGTMSTSMENLSPCVSLDGLTTSLYSYRIDPTIPVYNYVTQPILFNNPSTSARFYFSVKIPSGNTMNVYYKPYYSVDDDMSKISWTQLTPTSPVVANSTSFVEYEYDLSGIGSFVGYVVKVVFNGSDPANAPFMNSFMSIALA